MKVVYSAGGHTLVRLQHGTRMDQNIKLDRRPRRWRKPLIGAAVTTALLGLVAVALWPAQPAPISPIAIQFGPLDEAVPINAVLVPTRTDAVATRTGGTVAALIAHPGQVVKAGDPLLKLDNPDLQRQLAEAQSVLIGARSDLISQQADAEVQVGSLQVAKSKAASDLAIAEMQLEAERKLQQDGIVSQLTLRKTEAERNGKQADLADATRRSIEATRAVKAKVSAALEHVNLLQARTDSLAASVAALTLRAPFDGIVAKIEGKPGATVVPGTTLAEVITPTLQINLEVAEQFANAIQPGQLLRLQGGLTGRVRSLSPAAEGGVVKGNASIEGDTKALRSNTTLPGEAVISARGTGLFVALDGVNIAGRTISAKVQTPAGDSQTRLIRFGPRYRQKVVVLSGAARGESIVALDTGAAE